MLIVGIDGQNQVRCCEEGVRCNYTYEGRAIVLKDACPALFFTYYAGCRCFSKRNFSKSLTKCRYVYSNSSEALPQLFVNFTLKVLLDRPSAMRFRQPPSFQFLYSLNLFLQLQRNAIQRGNQYG